MKNVNLDDVTSECQANLVAIIRAAVAQGINHFETAKGYGCSELQFGHAFKELFASGELRREDIIIQTKVNPRLTAEEFRADLEESFRQLQVDGVLGGYIDFFSFHGINRENHVDLVNDVLFPVVNEYVAAGKIRHVGFSTHGKPRTITRAIETGKFAYVNLHYDFIGSYTASGSGPTAGCRECVEAAAARDMGIFIISPYDKGGKLYKPSAKFARLCSGDDSDIATPGGCSSRLGPIEFNSLWLWMHSPPAHTLVVGAARPSDLDRACDTARWADADRAGAEKALRDAEARLVIAAKDAVGEEWYATWSDGLPDCYQGGGGPAGGGEASLAQASLEPTGADVCYIVWLHLLVKAWGLAEYAKDRYGTLENNAKGWDDAKTFDENTKGWGYMPGSIVRPGTDIGPHLAASKDPILALRCLNEAHTWLNKADGKIPDDMAADCATAYDLQPDKPFPERG